MNIPEIKECIGNRQDTTYHLDYIIPLSLFKLELKKYRELANSKHNLRWISSHENLIKNNTIDFELIYKNEELVLIAKEIGIIQENTDD